MFKIKAQRSIAAPLGSYYDDFNMLDKYNNIFVIADGVGSYPAADEASSITCNGAYCFLRKSTAHFKNGIIPEEKILDHIKIGIEHANEVLYTLSENIDWFYEKRNEFSEKKRAGSTLDICYLFNNHAYIGHVGDSSVYLLRGNDLVNLTAEQEYESEDEGLEKLKALTGEKSLNAFVGENKKVDPLLKKVQIQENDIILMTTDGLTKLLYDEEIKEILQKSDFANSADELAKAARNPRKVAEYISKRKNENLSDVLQSIVGRDSITIIAIKVEGYENGR